MLEDKRGPFYWVFLRYCGDRASTKSLPGTSHGYRAIGGVNGDWAGGAGQASGAGGRSLFFQGTRRGQEAVPIYTGVVMYLNWVAIKEAEKMKGVLNYVIWAEREGGVPYL